MLNVKTQLKQNLIFKQSTTVQFANILIKTKFKIYLFLAVRPDLVNFRHFGTMLFFWPNLKWSNLVFGQILSYLWQILYSIGRVFIDVNGPMLNK